MLINWCEWTKIINYSFDAVRQRINALKPRYVILYGGRGSGKSDFTAKYLIYRCLTDKYFRFILVRNTYSTIKDSQYQTIKDLIVDLGLAELFDFKLQPLEIECKNGNKFIARGCDDTTKLKSIKDPSGAWFEEDIPSESDFITISTSIRTGKADTLLEIFTINPEVDGDFTEHWFWKKFFLGQANKSFEGRITEQIDGKVVEIDYLVNHSTYHDNRWLPDGFKAFLEALRQQDPYYYTIYCLGEWGNRVSGGNFYKHFDRYRNVSIDIQYDPNKALHISFDFNVNPYMTLTIWQLEGLNAHCIGEICSQYPKNNTQGICNEFKKLYPSHSSGLYVYGDPAGKHQDTRSEAGFNDYKIIDRELLSYHPVNRVASVAPSISGRGLWINTLFREERAPKVYISENCSLLIADLMNTKEASDGTKFKQKVKDDKTGVSYEKYGHLSDSLDYLLTVAFAGDYGDYQRGGMIHKPTLGLGRIPDRKQSY